MAFYRYSAYDSHGARVNGELSAEDQQNATTQIASQQLTLVELKEVSASQVQTLGSSKVNLADLEFFTSQIRLLLNNGVRIDRAMELLAKGRTRPGLKNLTEKMLQKVRSGEALSSLMRQYPDIFDALYINLVALGEASGRLPQVFDGLAETLKFRRQLSAKIVQAMVYPAVITVTCVLCILFIFNFIVPRLEGMFTGVEELPVYTELLLQISHWVSEYQFHGAALLALMGAGLWRTRKLPQLQRAKMQILLNVPGLSHAIYLLERIRYCSAMSLMLSAKVPLDQAMQLAAESVKHPSVRVALFSARERVKTGHALSRVLANNPLFPEIQTTLLEVGEESANLAAVFTEIASRGREAFSSWTDRFTGLLEPLLIIVMGLIIGSVVVVMLMSIISINDINF